jgi:hypothetical protein
MLRSRQIASHVALFLSLSAAAAAQDTSTASAQEPPADRIPLSARVIVVAPPDDAERFGGVLIPDTMMRDLPIFGRNFLAAAMLAPGFNGNAYFPNAQGQLPSSTNLLVDGTSGYSRWRGAPRSFYSGYALDAIRSVRVRTHLYGARYGDALASSVSAETQSGSDVWRGDTFAVTRNTALTSMPVFAVEKPTTSAHQFGLSAGGPLGRARTYLFASYEGARARDRNIVASPAAYGVDVPDYQDEHLAFARLDRAIGSEHALAVRYTAQTFRWRHEPGGLTLPGSGTSYTNDVHTVAAAHTAAPSAGVANDLRVQWSHFVDMRRDLAAGPFVARAGYSYEGGELGAAGFGADPETALEVADTLLIAHGGRTLRVGGRVRWDRAHATGVHHAGGAYFFGGSPALFPEPYLYVQSAPPAGAAFVDPRVLAAAGFAEYEWRPANGLTLNTGLRYDVERITHVRHFDVPVDGDNVAPRLTAAWTIGHTVVRAGAGLYVQQHLLHAIDQVQLQGPDGAVAVTLTPASASFPRYPEVLTPTAALLAAPHDVFRVGSSFRNPNSVQVGAGVQRQVLGVIVSADYLHLRGRDLVSVIDANAPESVVKPAVRSVEAADGTRPIGPAPATYRKVLTIGNEGDSWYRALQIAATRTSGRLRALTSYTLSEAEDRANYLLPEDSRNLAAERARASTDVRHMLAVALVLRIPGAGAWTRGWTVSAVGTFRSNRPYTISWGDDRNGTTQNDARPGPRNTGRTGPYRAIDGSIARRFGAGRVTTDVRIDVFNLLDTVNYDQYVGQLLSPLYGQPISAFPSRRAQVGLALRF